MKGQIGNVMKENLSALVTAKGKLLLAGKGEDSGHVGNTQEKLAEL